MDPMKMYEYLARSRARVFGWARPLTEVQYRSEHPIGLGSLARTLHHIRAAETLYMRRVSGETGVLDKPAPADNPVVTSALALPLNEVERMWLQTADRTRATLERASGAGWQTAMRMVTNWDGAEVVYEASPADFFSQLVIHEVHHRTQALHMFRRLGVETGEIDYSTMMFLQGLPEG